MKVFISGSIAIKKLPKKVEKSILKIIDKNLEILVGDANGVDSLIQDFCKKNQYFNVKIYTINSIPRYKADEKFNIFKVDVSNKIKRNRQRQQEKDKQMTLDSDYSLIIWNGKSKGSYANIIRAIEKKQKLKVYLTEKNDFLPQDKINQEYINSIYKKNNNYLLESPNDLQNNFTNQKDKLKIESKFIQQSLF
jgi:hypothetical protein